MTTINLLVASLAAFAALLALCTAANPVFEVAVPTQTVGEGGPLLSLCVNVTAGDVTLGTNATVEVASADGTATSADYSTAAFAGAGGTSGNLTFVGGGETQQCVPFSIDFDLKVELNETFSFAIVAIYDAPGGSIGDDGETIVTIVSEDILFVEAFFSWNDDYAESFYEEYGIVPICAELSDETLGDGLSVAIGFTFQPGTLTSDDIIVPDSLSIEFDENNARNTRVCLNPELIDDKIFEYGYDPESATFAVSVELSDPRIPVSLTNDVLELGVYSSSSPFSSGLVEKGVEPDMHIFSPAENIWFLESDGEVELCLYAAVPERQRGWQYPIPVTIEALGINLIEGVDFNFTETDVVIPPRVLDVPVLNGDGPDPGTPFCFNLTLYDNDVETATNAAVEFTIRKALNVDDPARTIFVEVFDDDGFVLGFTSSQPTLKEADPAGIQVCVELVKTPNGIALGAAASALVTYSTIGFAGYATVNVSASTPVIVTFPEGSMPGTSRCLILAPIQNNVTLIAPQVLTINIGAFTENAAIPVDSLDIEFVDDDQGAVSFTNSTVIRVREDVGTTSFCYDFDSVGSDGISGNINLYFISVDRTADSNTDFSFSAFSSRQDIDGSENATTILARPTLCVPISIEDDDYPEYEEHFMIIPFNFYGFAFPDNDFPNITVIIEDDDRVDVALVTLETSGYAGSTIQVCAEITAGVLGYQADIKFVPDFDGETATAADLMTGANASVATFATGAGPGSQACVTFELVGAPAVYQGDKTFGVVIDYAEPVEAMVFAALAPVLNLSNTSTRAVVTILENTTPAPTTTTTTTEGPGQGLNVDGSSDSTGLFGLSKGGGGVLLTVIILAAIGIVVAIVVGILMCRGGADDKNGSKTADTNDEEAGGAVPMKAMGGGADTRDDSPEIDHSEPDEVEDAVLAGTDVAVADAGSPEPAADHLSGSDPAGGSTA